MRLYIRLIETVLLLGLALLSDIKTYKIKNAVTLPFIFMGTVTNIYLNGINGLFTSIMGILIPIIFLTPLYALRMLGAGDIKLFSAIGAVMGNRFILYSMAFSFLEGGVIALFLMLSRKNFKQRFVYFFQYLKHCFLTLSFQPYISFENKDDINGFPFALAVVCGSITAYLTNY
ncbi:MAG: prepilin peptidase [Firmicutes bacterium]|nr:prepilin peptidase [Bacillota bacterium]